MSKRSVLTSALVLMRGRLASPLYAQEPAAPRRQRRDHPVVDHHRRLRARRSRPASARSARARPSPRPPKPSRAIPSATGDIRGALLLGLVLIESLVIYVLLISLILFFLNRSAARSAGRRRSRRFETARVEVTRPVPPFLFGGQSELKSHRHDRRDGVASEAKQVAGDLGRDLFGLASRFHPSDHGDVVFEFHFLLTTCASTHRRQFQPMMPRTERHRLVRTRKPLARMAECEIAQKHRGGTPGACRTDCQSVRRPADGFDNPSYKLSLKIAEVDSRRQGNGEGKT